MRVTLPEGMTRPYSTINFNSNSFNANDVNISAKKAWSRSNKAYLHVLVALFSCCHTDGEFKGAYI